MMMDLLKFLQKMKKNENGCKWNYYSNINFQEEEEEEEEEEFLFIFPKV
jgi:hypothetical protein